MGSWLTKWLKRFALLLTTVAVTLLGVRIYDTQWGAPLERWHTFVPDELTAKQIDGASWSDCLKAEDKIFAEVMHEVSQRLDPGERIPVNRYFAGSPVYPEGLIGIDPM
jgi:hypothetical protein